MGHSRSCSQFLDKILLGRSKNSPCPAKVLNLSLKLTHCRRIPFLLHREFIDFQLSSSIRFRTANSSYSSILGNHLRDLPEKLWFSHLILQRASSFPFEPDQLFGSPARAPSSGIQAVCLFHNKQYQNSAFPNLFYFSLSLR